MSVASELEKVILKAAIDGTFSQEAVEQYRAVMTENSELKAANESQKKQLSSLRDDLGVLNNRSEVMRNELEGYKAREKELQDRESQAEVLEMTVKYEQKRVEDHRSMVGLIFRNTKLRSQAMTPGFPGFVDAAGMTQYPNYPEKNDLETEET